MRFVLRQDQVVDFVLLTPLRQLRLDGRGALGNTTFSFGYFFFMNRSDRSVWQRPQTGFFVVGQEQPRNTSFSMANAARASKDYRTST